jgi:hypothetical protein
MYHAHLDEFRTRACHSYVFWASAYCGSRPLRDSSRIVKLPQTLGKIDGASGCVLQLQSGYFFITAEHVLTAYEKRICEGELLNWQIGKLPPLNPISRIAWRDQINASKHSQMPYRPTDIVLLRLSEEEAEQACGEAMIIPTPAQWPPPPLRIGQQVVMVGYPNQLRTVDLAETMNREACGLVFQVESIGDGYCKCVFLYKNVINFGHTTQPDLNNTALGGMSGCPVFAVDSVAEGGLVQYPRLAGVFAERWNRDTTVDVIQIATFEKINERYLIVPS